jgi:hypothetical protein
MANNPNDNDPKPVPPKDPSAHPDSEEIDLARTDAESSGELPALPDEGELSGVFASGPGSGTQLSDASFPGVGDLPGDSPSIGDGLSAVDAGAFDAPVPDADPASLSGVGPLGDLPDLAEELSASDVGLGSTAPVSPSEAWLDLDSAAATSAPLG